MTEKVKNQLNELGKIANQISDLVNNSKPFGNTEKQTLFLAYFDIDFFKNLKVEVWSTMSDYTHSGSYQLSRRWTDGELKPNYKESEILEIIIQVTKAYLLFANMLFKIHNYQDEENKVLEILLEYKKNTNTILEAIYG